MTDYEKLVSPARLLQQIQGSAAEPGSRPIPLDLVPALVASWGLPRPGEHDGWHWMATGREGRFLRFVCDGQILTTTAVNVREFLRGEGVLP